MLNLIYTYMSWIVEWRAQDKRQRDGALVMTYEHLPRPIPEDDVPGSSA